MTEVEFVETIEKIDEEQQQENIPIHHRVIDAIKRFEDNHKTTMVLGLSDLIKTENKYDTVNLVKSISEWYQTKYGEKVKKEFVIGNVALLLNGAIYKMQIPRIFGKFRLISKVNESDEIAENEPVLNVFAFVENLTPLVRKNLTKQEKYILKLFTEAEENFRLISERSKTTCLFAHAQDDFMHATESLLNNNINCGSSKWSSLQATEKVLKAILTLYKIDFKSGHNLTVYIDKLRKIGFPKINKEEIESIQCEAKTRYGEVNVTIAEAIRAHHKSIHISNQYLKYALKNGGNSN